MSLKSILEESKSKLTALLSFANETTGQSDANIGDAIRTLCDGYGGGGGDVLSGDVLITGTQSTLTINHNAGNPIRALFVYATDLPDFSGSTIPTGNTRSALFSYCNVIVPGNELYSRLGIFSAANSSGSPTGVTATAASYLDDGNTITITSPTSAYNFKPFNYHWVAIPA